MKHLKLRAWYQKEKAMYYFSNPQLEDGSMMSLDKDLIISEGEEYEMIIPEPKDQNCSTNVEWMLGTNHKDINSKEIYVGDVVITHEQKCKGKGTNFCKDNCPINIIKFGPYENDEGAGIGFYFSNGLFTSNLIESKNEIVGNIYENPELNIDNE